METEELQEQIRMLSVSLGIGLKGKVEWYSWSSTSKLSIMAKTKQSKYCLCGPITGLNLYFDHPFPFYYLLKSVPFILSIVEIMNYVLQCMRQFLVVKEIKILKLEHVRGKSVKMLVLCGRVLLDQSDYIRFKNQMVCLFTNIWWDLFSLQM